MKRLFIGIALVSNMLVACTGDKTPKSYGYFAVDNGQHVALELTQIWSSRDATVIPHKAAIVNNSKPFKIIIYGNTIPESPFLMKVGKNINSFHESDKLSSIVVPKKVDTGQLVELTFNQLEPGEYALYDYQLKQEGRALIIK